MITHPGSSSSTADRRRPVAGGLLRERHACTAAVVREDRANDAADPFEELIGRRFGPIVLEARLGAGSVGVVFRARHDRHGEVCAKVLAPEHAARSKSLRRFRREAEAARRLRHPNAVRGLGLLEGEDGTLLLLSELVRGRDLKTHLDRAGGRLALETTLRVGAEVAAGLAAAHDLGLVHRDLKPSNILLDEEDGGAARIADLGLVLQADDAADPLDGRTVLTREGGVLGTPHYMAPEQWRSPHEVDGRTDLYALGATLYHCLAGAPPFSGEVVADLMLAHLQDAPLPLRRRAPETPAAVEELVAELLAKDPADRPDDAARVADRLAHLAARAERDAESVAEVRPATLTLDTEAPPAPPPMPECVDEDEATPASSFASASSLDASESASDAEPDPETERRRRVRRGRILSLLQRTVTRSAVLSISIAIHVTLLLILGLLVIATPATDDEATVIVAMGIPGGAVVSAPIMESRETLPDVKLPTDDEPVIVHDADGVVGDASYPTDVVAPEKRPETRHLQRRAGAAMRAAGGGAPSELAQRFDRAGLLAREGGGEETEAAVTDALEWLARHQSPDGRWDADGFWNNCGEAVCKAAHDYGGHLYESGTAPHDGAVTGLAILAFLGSGNTHRFGPHRRTVDRGLRWLIRQQEADGATAVYRAKKYGHWIYDQAITTMALAEAYAISRDFTLKKHAQRAVDFCVAARNANRGWRYGVRTGDDDVSVTGWMALAFKAARSARLSYPDETWDGIRAVVEANTRREDGFTGYHRGKDGSAHEGRERLPTMTAVGLTCRIAGGQSKRDAIIRRGQRLVMHRLPSWPSPTETSETSFYYWYYGSLAMFQIGGPDWRRWNRAMTAAILDKQRRGGDEAGSWDPVGEWGHRGGRVYATAILALTLEVYYRYERSQKGPAHRTVR